MISLSISSTALDTIEAVIFARFKIGHQWQAFLADFPRRAICLDPRKGGSGESTQRPVDDEPHCCGAQLCPVHFRCKPNRRSEQLKAAIPRRAGVKAWLPVYS
jgi:hypothetical protein